MYLYVSLYLLSVSISLCTGFFCLSPLSIRELSNQENFPRRLSFRLNLFIGQRVAYLRYHGCVAQGSRGTVTGICSQEEGIKIDLRGTCVAEFPVSLSLEACTRMTMKRREDREAMSMHSPTHDPRTFSCSKERSGKKDGEGGVGRKMFSRGGAWSGFKDVKKDQTNPQKTNSTNVERERVERPSSSSSRVEDSTSSLLEEDEVFAQLTGVLHKLLVEVLLDQVQLGKCGGCPGLSRKCRSSPQWGNAV